MNKRGDDVSNQTLWPMPEATTKSDGSARQVGVEFELQGIPVDRLAKLTASTLGGEIEMVSEAEYDIRVPDEGDYRVEVDYELLKQLTREQKEAGSEDKSALESLAVDALSAVSSVIVPCEVITPPLAMESMPKRMQELTDAIRDAGGKGTSHSVLYAFGLHLNVEPPDLKAETVTAYMKAFACLFDWIVWQGKVDWSRRLTPYIKRYPAQYDLKLTDPDYWPDWDMLINDYLELNASRNRALDMLPLFCEMNAAVVRSAVDDDRVKPRPAFHYRLANCAIDDPDWSIADPWSRWLQIEHLARDRDALNACCREFQRDRERLLYRVDTKWRESVTKWLTN